MVKRYGKSRILLIYAVVALICALSITITGIVFALNNYEKYKKALNEYDGGYDIKIVNSFINVRKYAGNDILLPVQGVFSDIFIGVSKGVDDECNLENIKKIKWHEEFNGKKLSVVIFPPPSNNQSKYKDNINFYVNNKAEIISEKSFLEKSAVLKCENKEYVFIYVHRDDISISDKKIERIFKYVITVEDENTNKDNDALIIDYVNSLTYGD